MSGSQKALKVISVVLVVFSLLGLVLGILLIASAGFTGVGDDSIQLEGSTMDLATAAMGFGIFAIAGSLVNLIIAALGIRGANRPAKIMPFLVFAIIGLAFGLLTLVGDFTNGMAMNQMASDIIDVALLAICVGLALRIRKQA